mmetsp:Transcript_13012/g.16640  ORF Transcript_13012/g.16640 Transcript_13012/m.16640 type:complete len:111 (-) Transcript_13012:83-415(-)
MPASVAKYLQIPFQVETEEEYDTAKALSAIFTVAAISIMGSSFLLNLLLAGSMTLLWSLLNTLQIVEYIGLFNIKLPGNVGSFNDFFERITEVQIVDPQEILSTLFYFPE